ncbi:helix-turn-helix transcriptional regulator [Actinomyces capricornis]|uniref:WYL domain-containing protein n=1 Tax=Actinomyces capricornis TaxID=2755559 RepID=A0ABM7UEW4_9ACTO|nr:WYL domain-containing protein [Actinomyces capricornis]BDA65715.1 WYL domain-containing protein [Actinomyces capricornis]
MSEQSRSAEERLVNLLLTLRSTRRGMSAEEVLEAVPGYAADNAESARRKFERDKETLRELGIALSTRGGADEPRYRISEEDYVLPELRLDASQAAALDLAASAWRHGSLPATARRALIKLRAVAEEPRAPAEAQDLADASAPLGAGELSADLSGEQIPEVLIAAVDERRLISFDYLSAHSGTSGGRTVEPHHLRMSQGAWYLDAVEAGQERTFNLARLSGLTVQDPPGAFIRRPRAVRAPQRALLAIRSGRALSLRLMGEEVEAGAAPADDDAPPLPEGALEGRDLYAVDYEDRFSFAGTLASMGDAVLVLAPAQLRRSVVSHLRAAAALGGLSEETRGADGSRGA